MLSAFGRSCSFRFLRCPALLSSASLEHNSGAAMFSVLRQERPLLGVLFRAARPRFNTTVATGFVPPAAPFDASPRPPEEQRDRDKKKWSLPSAKPPSPNTYSGKAVFYDSIDDLEDAINATRRLLQRMQLLPLPRHILKTVPPPQPAWKDRDALALTLGIPLTPSRYSHILEHLRQLDEYRRIAATGGFEVLASKVSGVLEMFEREDKVQYLARGIRNPVPIDEYGRAYALGRRKESSARVWVIPTRLPEPPAEEPKAAEAAPAEEEVPDLRASLPNSKPAARAPPPPVPVTQVIINNAPLSEYFLNAADRERVLRPLRLAGLLGAYNVFAIARGGGTTGQSGAISHGLAKCLVAHAPEVRRVLTKAKLLRRDPRMVERKKPGRAKAREGYTWVKR